jgi:hypothetical protein
MPIVTYIVNSLARELTTLQNLMVSNPAPKAAKRLEVKSV